MIKGTHSGGVRSILLCIVGVPSRESPLQGGQSLKLGYTGERAVLSVICNVYI